MRQLESKLQINCVNVFRLQYPHLKDRLIAIPNGGNRDAITGAILKKEGVRAGTSDLLLAVPRFPYGGMWIEMKVEKGRLSPNQVAFIKDMQSDYYCCVCRSVEQFLTEIKNYLHQKQ